MLRGGADGMQFLVDGAEVVRRDRVVRPYRCRQTPDGWSWSSTIDSSFTAQQTTFPPDCIRGAGIPVPIADQG